MAPSVKHVRRYYFHDDIIAISLFCVEALFKTRIRYCTKAWCNVYGTRITWSVHTVTKGKLPVSTIWTLTIRNCVSVEMSSKWIPYNATLMIKSGVELNYYTSTTITCKLFRKQIHSLLMDNWSEKCFLFHFKHSLTRNWRKSVKYNIIHFKKVGVRRKTSYDFVVFRRRFRASKRPDYRLTRTLCMMSHIYHSYTYIFW